MLHAFKPAPTPTLTQKKKIPGSHTSQTNTVFDSFCLSPPQKKKKKESYSSQKNSVWGSSTLRQQKALLFAK